MKKGLSRERLIAEALALVDEQGLSALSMRALARRLGVDPMAAYHHLPGREALLDGVVEAVVAEVNLSLTGHDPAPGSTSEPRPWQQELRTLYDGLWAGLLRHPNVLPLLTGRSWDTGESLGLIERALGLCVRAGLPRHDAALAANATTLFLVSLAAAAASRTPEAATRTAERFARLDPAEFPQLTALVAGDQGATYEQMRTWWLDSLIARIEADRGEA